MLSSVRGGDLSVGSVYVEEHWEGFFADLAIDARDGRECEVCYLRAGVLDLLVRCVTIDVRADLSWEVEEAERRGGFVLFVDWRRAG